MFNFIKKYFNKSYYKNQKDSVIISCFYNPKNNPERVKAFNRFYESIQGCNYRIIECVINGQERQTPTNDKNISVIYTDSNLWHKEQLLNTIIKKLPTKFKYVFWLDADILMSNKNWIVEASNLLKDDTNLVQLFKYCIHLNKDEELPKEKLSYIYGRQTINCPNNNRRVWKSYAYNYKYRFDNNNYYSTNYDTRGHVGFAWGARLETLREIYLYDKALIGGADGIMAYAGTNQLMSKELANTREMFKDNLKYINTWSELWYKIIKGKVSYIENDLYHIWHGDIKNREYYKRIKEFSSHINEIKEKDENGLYISKNPKHNDYINNYYNRRENVSENSDTATSFALGYATGIPVGPNFGASLVGSMLSPNNQISNDSNNSTELDSSPNQNDIKEDVPSTQPSSLEDSNQYENFS